MGSTRRLPAREAERDPPLPSHARQIMQKLPSVASVYLVVVCVAAGGASAYTCSRPMPAGASSSLWELGALVLLSAALGWRTLNLVTGAQEGESVSMSLGFVLVFCALLRFSTLR